MIFPDFSLTFPVCSKFPDFSLTGKCLPIFPGFPVRVGTLLPILFFKWSTSHSDDLYARHFWVLSVKKLIDGCRGLRHMKSSLQIFQVDSTFFCTSVNLICLPVWITAETRSIILKCISLATHHRSSRVVTYLWMFFSSLHIFIMYDFSHRRSLLIDDSNLAELLIIHRVIRIL